MVHPACDKKIEVISSSSVRKPFLTILHKRKPRGRKISYLDGFTKKTWIVTSTARNQSQTLLSFGHRRKITKAGDESTQGNIQDAADWARSKAVADTMQIPIPVYSWYTKPEDGELWRPNQLVSVESAAMKLKILFTHEMRPLP